MKTLRALLRWRSSPLAEGHPMRAAQVYARGDLLLGHSLSQTREGMWTFVEPVLSLPTDTSEVEVGEAVRTLLRLSRNHLPNRDPRDMSLIGPLLRAANTATYEDFSPATKCVLVNQHGDDIAVYHSRPPRGSEKGSGFFVRRLCARSCRSDA
jgi:hypothetical protein